MKYSFDTYDLYKISNIIHYTIRVRVRMKQEVDLDILRHAVNVAAKRYPYFLVKVSVDEAGAYVFSPNEAAVAVLKTSAKNPDLCSPEVHEHLLYVDSEGKDIYFNISHALAGGRGAFPWVMTCVYAYVVEKFHVTPEAPAIRKPDSPLLPGENEMPCEAQFAEAVALPTDRYKGGKSLMLDYLHSIFNPFRRSNEYFVFTFSQQELLRMAKENDNSLASLFSVLMFKAMDSVLPAKDPLIVGEISHNPAASVGLPNTRYNLLSHIKIPYKRSMASWPLAKLGAVTRGSILLQTTPPYNLYETQQAFACIHGLDETQGHKNKLRYAQKHNTSSGKDAVHGTYVVGYTGNMDWGEVADYLDSYVAIIDGHQMLQITALEDKVFCCYHQVLRTDKYIDAFRKVLDDTGFTYTVEGPFPKNLPRHKLK